MQRAARPSEGRAWTCPVCDAVGEWAVETVTRHGDSTQDVMTWTTRCPEGHWCWFSDADVRIGEPTGRR